MKLRAILAIASKDLLDALKNQYLLVALLLPLGASLLFRVFFPSPGAEYTLTVAVHDPGGSRLVASLRELPGVRLLPVASAGELPGEVKRKAAGGLAVPAGFDAAVQAGQRPELLVYLNGRRGGGELAAFRRLVEQQVWALAAQEAPARVVFNDVARPAGTEERDLRIDRYFLVVVILMALAMAGLLVVPTLLVEEKEKRTLDVLLLSPAGPAEVVAGKAIVGLVYSLVMAGLLVVMNPGSVALWTVTIVGVLLGALFLVAVGLLMGSLCRTTTQVNTWSSIVMLVLLVPSWLTVVQAPAFVEAALRLIPTYYLAEALAAQAASPGTWGYLAILAASAGATLALVVWRLRHSEI